MCSNITHSKSVMKDWLVRHIKTMWTFVKRPSVLQ